VKVGLPFDQEDIYIYYDFEEVMFRWDHQSKQVYRKFYSEQEFAAPIPQDNRLYTDALLSGSEITQEEYDKGKSPS
jgi:hypothetical protein